MNHFLFLAAVTLLTPLPPLFSSPHLCATHSPPLLIANYRILDMGETGLKEEQLTKLGQFSSLSPTINNRRMLVYNKEDGGYVRDLDGGEYALTFPGVTVFTHAINDAGNVLVSLHRKEHDIEWMVWNASKYNFKHSCKQGCPSIPSRNDRNATKDQKIPDNLKKHVAQQHLHEKLSFSSINGRGAVMGYKEMEGKPFPLIWSPVSGIRQLDRMGFYDIKGMPKAINNNGTVIGVFEDVNDTPPFIWNDSFGLEVLRNYREQINYPGWIELADMVLNEDNVVYGTFVVKYVGTHGNADDLNHHFLYRWDSQTGIKSLGIKDMRVTSINTSNATVGSQNGRAVICHEGKSPVDLKGFIANEDPAWELIEATKINDNGEIVGYGKYQGKMHIFLLQPTP